MTTRRALCELSDSAMRALGVVVLAVDLTGCGSPETSAPRLAVASAADVQAPSRVVAVKAAAAPAPASVVAAKASERKASERTVGSDARTPRDATFDDVKLDLKKDEPYRKDALTAKVKELDGKWIKIRGYILPSFQDTDIKQFVLVRDNMECCFGPGAALHDCILVEMLDDARASFTVRPVTVVGKFTIKELADADGKTLAIYHLDGREVK